MQIIYIILMTSIVCLAQTSAPIIAFDKTHHDFGRVPPGKSIAHKYNITNKGNAPLQIKEVKESCGCTIARLPKWKLEPGESASIEALFDSSGMLGNIHKTITVISDDPANPKIELTFGASVVQDIMPSKSVVLFNAVSRYVPTSTMIRLESGLGRPVEVTDINIPVPYLACEAQSEGNDVVLSLSINGQFIPKQTSRGSDVLTVHTASLDVPELHFVIEWDTAPIIAASQKRIVWNGHVGTELRTAITLIHSGGKPFRILDAISTSPHLQVSGITENSLSEHKFDVIMAADAKMGMYRENLTMKLDDPEQGELEISVAAVLR